MDQSGSQGVSGASSQRLPTALKMATASSPRRHRSSTAGSAMTLTSKSHASLWSNADRAGAAVCGSQNGMTSPCIDASIRARLRSVIPPEPVWPM